MTKKILAIGAHPDDVEQYVGGTLILLKNAGYKITIAALTDGACGSRIATAKEIVAIRLKEAKNAAKKLGATYVNLGISDGSIEYNLENTRKVAELIRNVDPEIIITHPSKSDYMTDHWHTGALVLWAVPEAVHKNFETSSGNPIKHQPYLYHTDPQGLVEADGQIARVNTVVDIASVIEQKLDAFAMHESQMGFLQHRQKGNAAEKTRRWAVVRGEQVRIEYGEGFTQELLAEYPRKNILAELLPGKVYTL